jgi:hypothetical protein
VRLGRGARGDHRQRKGQSGTARDDVVDGVGLGGQPRGPNAAGEHVAGIGRGGQVQRQHLGANAGNQAGQLIAAGHQH